MKKKEHEKRFDASKRFFAKEFGGLLLSGMYLSDAFQAKAQRHTDHPSVHGMALIGDQTLFLSHLPLFSSPGRRSPHNYQALLEAAFAGCTTPNVIHR